MASPVRLHMLNLLAQRAWSVGELAAEIGESMAATSAHLKPLRAAGIVEVQKRGRVVFCQVTADEVVTLLQVAGSAAEALMPELREAARLADEDPYLLQICDFSQLSREVIRGDVLLLDLRPEDEFLAGHLPGAVSCPFRELEEDDLQDLREAPPVVGYCRGPWCRMARQGVNLLNQRGIPTRRLRAGVVEWRAAGLPLEFPESPPESN